VAVRSAPSAVATPTVRIEALTGTARPRRRISCTRPKNASPVNPPSGRHNASPRIQYRGPGVMAMIRWTGPPSSQTTSPHRSPSRCGPMTSTSPSSTKGHMERPRATNRMVSPARRRSVTIASAAAASWGVNRLTARRSAPGQWAVDRPAEPSWPGVRRAAVRRRWAPRTRATPRVNRAPGAAVPP